MAIDNTVITLSEIKSGVEFANEIRGSHFFLFTRDLPTHHKEHQSLTELEQAVKGDMLLLDAENLFDSATTAWLEELVSSVIRAGYRVLIGQQQTRYLFPDAVIIHVYVVTNRSPAVQFSPVLKRFVRLAIFDPKNHNLENRMPA